jgi:predicted 3-demethylubiquinone-9 3-methyltransferase (glyoxalase superfamily)
VGLAAGNNQTNIVFITPARLKMVGRPERMHAMASEHKITPCLWFDTQAEEAADFYTALFEGGRIHGVSRFGEGAPAPAGTAMSVNFELQGHPFIALNGGPAFRFTPAVSFLVACRTQDEVKALWSGLSPGGTPLMDLGEYPFSGLYGWMADRYGVSWQVMYFSEREILQNITPMLMFVGAQWGRAEEAITHYASVFRNSRVGEVMRYGEGEAPDRAGTIKHAGFTLEGQEFAAMDSAYPHDFAFNEAISFLVHCANQEEVDHYWGKLSSVPDAEQCGWLKDRFGLSWQIIPDVLGELLGDEDADKAQRVMQAMLEMKKIDIEGLKRAHGGR